MDSTVHRFPVNQPEYFWNPFYSDFSPVPVPACSLPNSAPYNALGVLKLEGYLQLKAFITAYNPPPPSAPPSFYPQTPPAVEKPAVTSGVAPAKPATVPTASAKAVPAPAPSKKPRVKCPAKSIPPALAWPQHRPHNCLQKDTSSLVQSGKNPGTCHHQSRFSTAGTSTKNSATGTCHNRQVNYSRPRPHSVSPPPKKYIEAVSSKKGAQTRAKTAPPQIFPSRNVVATIINNNNLKASFSTVCSGGKVCTILKPQNSFASTSSCAPLTVTTPPPPPDPSLLVPSGCIQIQAISSENVQEFLGVTTQLCQDLGTNITSFTLKFPEESSCPKTQLTFSNLSSLLQHLPQLIYLSITDPSYEHHVDLSPAAIPEANSPEQLPPLPYLKYCHLGIFPHNFTKL